MYQKTKLNFLGKAAAAIFLSAAAIFAVNTTNAKAETNDNTINVSSTDIAKNRGGASRAIQTALNQAAAIATDDNPYRVVVAPGRYQLSSALLIRSNTDLVLNDVTLTQEAGSSYTRNIIKVGDANDTQVGYYYKNITIEGGTLDENGNGATAVKATHTRNFTLKNVTVENTHNAHLMETAGVDGLTIEGCTFQNQTLDKEGIETLVYESIQLDILVQKHIEGYRSEALQTKNVTINNCSFTNVPRGVGSHTAFLNIPFDNINITNCNFSNIKSCAIQGMDWINCNISNNKITDSPRGIALYSVREAGTFLPSTASKEGNTTTTFSDEYIEPSTDQNITITKNNISCSGNDPYASYEPLGITLQGLILTQDSAKPDNDNGDILPAGNYFISGATVSDNVIKTLGHGIKLENTKNSSITSNQIDCSGTTGNTFYGIQLRNGSTSDSITDNTITDVSGNGVYVNLNSSASSITRNTITNPGKYGIDIEQSSAATISANKISTPAANGIYVFDGSNVKNIRSNEITSAGKYGIDVEKSSVSTISSNKMSKPAVNGIYIFGGSKAVNIKSNKITSAGKYGIDVEKSSVSTISSNKISKPASNGIYIFNGSTAKTIQSNQITSAGKYGIGLDKGNSNLIKSNTITKPSSNGINVFNNSLAKQIISNKITSGKGFGIGIYSSQQKTTLKSNKIKSCTRGNTNL